MKKGKFAYYIHSSRSLDEIKENYEDDKTTATQEEEDKFLIEVEMEYTEGKELEAIEKYMDESGDWVEIYTLYNLEGEQVFTEEDAE